MDTNNFNLLSHYLTQLPA